MSDTVEAPKKLTFRDLVMAAQSGDAGTRKQAYGAFQKWIKLAPQIAAADRLSHMQVEMLNKIFAQKGFSVGQPRAR